MKLVIRLALVAIGMACLSWAFGFDSGGLRLLVATWGVGALSLAFGDLP